MKRRSLLLSVPCVLATTFAHADVPQVVTDMPPIQSLVQQVMGDLSTPHALMPAGVSPHGYALRPSDARALQDADLIFWTGAQVEPWLAEMIDKVAGDAISVPLVEAEGTTRLMLRDGASFEKHEHDHGEADHDEHHDHDEVGHDDHDDHDHDDHDHDDHDAADHGDMGHDDHDHASVDGHAWLDPANARLWLQVIADDLAAADPEHAETYRSNASAAQQRLDQLTDRLSDQLAPLADLRFIVFHDAYHYFENRFGLAAAGSISLSDASTPSPARIREVQDTIRAQHVTCVFSEPQFNAGTVQTVLGGTEAKTVVIDPLGAALEPGAGFYGALMEDMAGAFIDCAVP